MARRKNKLVFQDAFEVDETEKIEDFDMAFALFIRDCKVRNLSPKTLDYYSNELNAFRKQLEN